MNKEFSELLGHITNRLNQEQLRHDIHKFDSGAVIVDIWKENLFYVIQISDKSIGLSLIEGNTAFDTAPDRLYYDRQAFLNDFEECIKRK